MSTFEEIRREAHRTESGRIAVAWPHDAEALGAILEAAQAGMAEPILVGDREVIRRVAAREGYTDHQLAKARFLDAETPEEAARLTVAAVRGGEADVVMKGDLETAILLKAVLDQTEGLRAGRILSHVAAFTLPTRDGFLLLSDAAMNIAPNVSQKREIILNAVEVASAIGIETPRVALLCAKEKVEPKMPATVEAGELRDLGRAGKIPGCVVSGPLALDNAVSVRAAQQKGIDDPVAGLADILIAPDIEAANILYKALVFLAGAANAGIIIGAAAPIVLTSRADSLESRINSIALAALHAHYRRTGKGDG